MSAMKAGVAPATLARPMQPMRIDRVGAPEEPVVEQSTVAANGNGKGRKVTKPVVNGSAKNGHVVADLLLEVSGS
jgi:hypothetical protein